MITRTEAFKTFAKIGLLSFGGPAGQIALMHKTLVEEKNWISETRFMHALNYCMLLPGPEATQLAVYIGWLLLGTWGGIMAGLLFILPGCLMMLALSIAYALYHAVPLMAGIFFGLKCAVLVIVIEAGLRIGKRALKNNILRLLAALSFIAIFLFNVPFPLIVLAAGLAGYFLPEKYLAAKNDSVTTAADSIIDRMFAAGNMEHTAPCIRHATGTLLIGLGLWLLPVLACFCLLGDKSVFTQLGLFFSQMAVVTFGGAYSVLSYVAQQAVQHYYWLDAADMMNGLGLAETTPGPLILVNEYVGFLAAFRAETGLPALVAGTLGAALTLWVTFVPCFLWIFLGGPYVERAQDNLKLKNALAAITAAVTGVIANLALWFALHVVFGRVNWLHRGLISTHVPVWNTISFPALFLSLISGYCLFRLKLGMAWTLGITAVLGLMYTLT